MESQQHRTIIYGASIALWLGFSMGATAQTPPSIADQQEQRDRAERQAREREWRQALPEVRGDDSARRALLADSAWRICFEELRHTTYAA